MRPHPTPHQIRKTIKWGGAAVTVLLVVVWILDGHGRPYLFVYWMSMREQRLHPFLTPVFVALFITTAAWTPDLLAIRRARREKRARDLNLCPKCNYDRAGIGAGAVCPECGAAPV